MCCAGTPADGRDACQGDSGGPLFVRGANAAGDRQASWTCVACMCGISCAAWRAGGRVAVWACSPCSRQPHHASAWCQPYLPLPPLFPLQVGITSWGWGCAASDDVPGVYTNLAYLRAWISSTTGLIGQRRRRRRATGKYGCRWA